MASHQGVGRTQTRLSMRSGGALGIVDITRQPRLAYEAYKETINPGYSGAPIAPPLPAPAPAAAGSACSSSQVQRRRRNVDMCACRRRDGASDLKQGWTCEGPSIVKA